MKQRFYLLGSLFFLACSPPLPTEPSDDGAADVARNDDSATVDAAPVEPRDGAITEDSASNPDSASSPDSAPDVSEDASIDARVDSGVIVEMDVVSASDAAADASIDVLTDVPRDASDPSDARDASAEAAADASIVCTPNARECDGMSATRVCNATGTAWVRTACGASRSCLAGVCRTWSCTPGSSTCATPSAVSVCNADGLGTTMMSCPGGSGCAAGRCSTWICTPGTSTSCSGTSQLYCNADGQGTTPSPCPTRANATPSCAAGACGNVCSAMFGDCDGSLTNGCETDLRNTTAHCGACGVVCAGSATTTASCSSGACVSTCIAGLADCDGNAGNGCESTSASDVRNCGACGNACPARANATASCSSGTCGIVCSAGASNCDGNASNGCESFTQSDPANCGACGTRCTGANAAMTCTTGRCAIASCNAGFANCDAVASNGCEVDTNTDARNCGACGNVCPGGAGTCVAGRCAAACTASTGDCDGNTANGCETDLSGSASHCGACGNACAGGQVCVVGVCSAGVPPALMVPRYDHTAVTGLDGNVYVMGGYDTAPLDSVERYQPATNTWVPRAAMPSFLRGHAAVLLADGRIFVAGGIESVRSFTRSALLYNPATDTWSGAVDLPTGRVQPAIARALDGRVYVIGGSVGSVASAVVEVWDPATNTWSTAGSLVTARTSARAFTAADGRIWVLGGVGGRVGSEVYLTSVEVYDPATNTWTTSSAVVPARRYNYGATVGTTGLFYMMAGYEFISGGVGSSRLATSFSPVTRAFTSLRLVPTSRATPAAATLLDGRVMVVGGSITGLGSTNRVEIYSPRTDTWR